MCANQILRSACAFAQSDQFFDGRSMGSQMMTHMSTCIFCWIEAHIIYVVPLVSLLAFTFCKCKSDVISYVGPKISLCLQGRSYICAKTHVRTHLDQKYGKILSQFLGMHDVMCTKRALRTNINLSKSNFDRICNDDNFNTLPRVC